MRPHNMGHQLTTSTWLRIGAKKMLLNFLTRNFGRTSNPDIDPMNFVVWPILKQNVSFLSDPNVTDFSKNRLANQSPKVQSL